MDKFNLFNYIFLSIFHFFYFLHCLFSFSLLTFSLFFSVLSSLFLLLLYLLPFTISIIIISSLFIFHHLPKWHYFTRGWAEKPIPNPHSLFNYIIFSKLYFSIIFSKSPFFLYSFSEIGQTGAQPAIPLLLLRPTQKPTLYIPLLPPAQTSTEKNSQLFTTACYTLPDTSQISLRITVSKEGQTVPEHALCILLRF